MDSLLKRLEEEGKISLLTEEDLEAIRASIGIQKPGKVLVDVEKLRKIQWWGEPEYRDGTHSSCIACGAWDDEGCKPDCWLSALLKDTPCST